MRESEPEAVQELLTKISICRYCRIVAADLLGNLFCWQGGDLLREAPEGTRLALLDLLCLQSAQKSVYQDLNSVAHVAYERSQDVIVIKGYQFQRAKVVAALALGVVLLHEPLPSRFVEENLSALLDSLRQLMLIGSPYARLAAIAVIADLARASDRARELILLVRFRKHDE